MGKQRKVAIFDIDGTIFRSSLLIELVEALIDTGIFPSSAKYEYEKEYTSWLNREGHYDAYISSIIKVFLTHIKGVPYVQFAPAADAVVARHQKRVYRYTRDLVAKLKEQRYVLLAISHSPKAILDTFCKSFGFDKVYGRSFELDATNTFTGKDTGFDKAAVLAHALEEENLTLRGSIGVGDSEGDISFLRMVERPICFNPNSVLYRTARRRHWTIVVERKDVIYTIT